MTGKFGRRNFIRGLGVAVAALGFPSWTEARDPAAGTRQVTAANDQASNGAPPAHTPTDRDAEQAYLFFTAPEAAFITAVVDRLIPADDTGPGAVESGVVHYIDRQLAGAFGRGYRMYLSGPWPSETLPSQGYQSALTPAGFYRLSMSGIDKAVHLANGGKSFAELGAEQQEAILQSLDKGEFQADGAVAKVFFDMLRGDTIEGYFADPAYGGNRDMAAWKMIGFPGARGGYAEVIVPYRNKAYGEVPVKLADLQQ